VRLRNIVASLAKDRIVILSTHIVSDIETIADTLVMLKDHRVMYAGAPGKLSEKMEGRIYELPAGQRMPAGAVYLSERTGESGAVTRFAAESCPPPENALPVKPGLEDAFLYIYRDDVGGGEMDSNGGSDIDGIGGGGGK
jgi:ABC-type multidrug transport system ATPase subunit